MYVDVMVPHRPRIAAILCHYVNKIDLLPWTAPRMFVRYKNKQTYSTKLRFQTKAKLFAFCPATQEKPEAVASRLFNRVAGPGIEPGSGGYEPPEIPLLYPAG